MNLDGNTVPSDIDFFLGLGAKAKRNDAGNWELQFYHTDLNDKDLKRLQLIPNIESILFYLTNISDEDIKELKKIQSLKRLGFYSCSKVTDASIKTLSMLNINDLAIVDTNISKAGKNELKRNSPNIHIHPE